MKRTLLLLLLLIIGTLQLPAQTTVKGKVSTVNGAPLKLAHVHLYPLGQGIGTEPIESIEVNKDGSYSLMLKEPGYYQIVVTGVDYNYVSLPLFADEKKASVTLDIHPPAFTYNQHPEEVMIIGDWNNFDFQTAEPMKKEENGKFTYTLKTDKKEVRYQLIGIASTGQGMRSVNAPNSNDYVYDGGGDYRSIIQVKPGKVTITFDPTDLPVTQGSTEPVIQCSQPAQQQLWEIDNLFTKTDNEFIQAVMAARESNQPIDAAGLWKPFGELMATFLDEEHAAPVRQFAALTYARVLRYSQNPENSLIAPEVLAEIRELLPPESPMWRANPALATVVAMHGVENPNDAIMEVVKKNPDHRVQGIALSQVAMNEFYTGDQTKAMEYYTTLKNNYSDVEEIGYVLAQLNPDKRIQKGKEVPDFEVTLLSNAGASNGSASTPVTVSKASMKGKYYMIDFWAVWCGPCIGEMPELHTAYTEFGGDNFEILSISFDGAPEDVAKFRKKKWDMPWLHAFAEGNFQSDLAKVFEVTGIPKPILVDPDGMIIATEGDLRGPKLSHTLARYLGDGQASR